jgi:hypothetical protein
MANLLGCDPGEPGSMPGHLIMSKKNIQPNLNYRMNGSDISVDEYKQIFTQRYPIFKYKKYTIPGSTG